jgi:hypothetical protein
MISQKLLYDLKIIMKEDFGMDVSLEDTTELGNMLLTLFGTLLKIDRELLPEGSEKYDF